MEKVSLNWYKVHLPCWETPGIWILSFWLLIRGMEHFSYGDKQRAGGAQGQVGWGPGQPELVGGSPAHSRGWGSVGFEAPTSPDCSVILTWSFSVSTNIGLLLNKSKLHVTSNVFCFVFIFFFLKTKNKEGCMIKYKKLVLLSNKDVRVSQDMIQTITATATAELAAVRYFRKKLTKVKL